MRKRMCVRVWAVGDGDKVERDDQNHPASAAQRGVGRARRAAVRRAQRDRRVPGDRRGRRRRHPRSFRSRLPELRFGRRPDRLPAAGRGSRPTTVGSADPDLHRRTTCSSRRRRTRRWVCERGSRRRPPNPAGWKPVQLVPENARAGRGGLPVSDHERTRIRRSGSRSTSRRDRARPASTGARSDGADGRPPAEAAGRARGLRFRPARREQHARDAVLRERPARALPRPQHGCGVSPLRAPPSRRARARLRRADACRPPGADSPARTSRASAGYEGPGPGVGNVIVPRTFYGPGTDFDDRASAWARERCVDDVSARKRCRRR